jgi:hypothetical protein
MKPSNDIAVCTTTVFAIVRYLQVAGIERRCSLRPATATNIIAGGGEPTRSSTIAQLSSSGV